MHFDLLLSASPEEFDQLHRDLEFAFASEGRPIRIQEKFHHDPLQTLIHLYERLRPCACVMHVMGNNLGAVPALPEIEALFNHLAAAGHHFLSRLPNLRTAFFADGALTTTYTQWEAFLALHLGIPVLAYATGDGKSAQAHHIECLLLAEPQCETKEIPRDSNPGFFLFSDYTAAHPQPTISPPPFRSCSIGENFFGRTSDLQALAEAFHQGDGSRFVTLVLSGPDGIGKTRLALEYAHRYAPHYQVRFFCRADSPENLRENIAAIAGPAFLNLPENQGDRETRFNAVVTWLKNNPGWLLILDNVDTEPAAIGVDELLIHHLPGHLFIATSLEVWRKDVTTIKLPTLPPATARALLLHGSGISEPLCAAEEAALVELVGEPDGRSHHPCGLLDGLALAIVQAGASIRQHQLTFTEYLRRFRENTAPALPWKEVLASDYPGAVATTWLTTIANLSPDARDLLAELSFFSSAPIPRDLFTFQDEILLLQLNSFCLLSLEHEPFSCVTLHRLVLEITGTLIPADQADAFWEKHLVRLQSWAPDGGQAPETWMKWAQFQPHAEKWDTHLRNRPLESVILNGIAGYEQYRNAAYQKAEPLYRRALAIDEASFGEHHSEVATDLNNLAQLLQDTNRLTEAESLMHRALVIDETNFGDHHPDVATDLNNLAQLLKATNQPTKAEPLMRRALAIDEASFGERHPEVGIDLNNLAQLLKATNRPTEAEPLMRRALEIFANFTRITGYKHPYLDGTIRNFLSLLTEMGHSEEEITAKMPEGALGFRF